jgi:hypothetical protein
MGLDKLVWGGEITKEFEVELAGQMRKIVLRSLSTEDSLSMELNIMNQEKPDTRAILADAVEMLSRSIVSIDGLSPDSAEETKQFLLKKTQTGDVFKILDKFQSLSADIQAEVKN